MTITWVQNIPTPSTRSLPNQQQSSHFNHIFISNYSRFSWKIIKLIIQSLNYRLRNVKSRGVDFITTLHSSPPAAGERMWISFQCTLMLHSSPPLDSDTNIPCFQISDKNYYFKSVSILYRHHTYTFVYITSLSPWNFFVLSSFSITTRLMHQMEAIFHSLSYLEIS